MSSRMDRYYKNHPDDMKRTQKNTELYETLYEKPDYTNIESASLDVGKEIDIDDIKELLSKRKSYEEDYHIVKPEVEVSNVKTSTTLEPGNYDIKEMLDKAKEERPDERRRSLEETQVLTLQELVSKKAYARKTTMNKEEVKDLINTIYDTNLLKSSDGDLLDELKSTGDTVVSPSIKQILDDAKKEVEADMDNSFFTSSLGFKNEDLKNQEELDESDSKTMSFLIILSIIFVIIVSFIIIKFVIL